MPYRSRVASLLLLPLALIVGTSSILLGDESQLLQEAATTSGDPSTQALSILDWAFRSGYPVSEIQFTQCLANLNDGTKAEELKKLKQQVIEVQAGTDGSKAAQTSLINKIQGLSVILRENPQDPALPSQDVIMDYLSRDKMNTAQVSGKKTKNALDANKIHQAQIHFSADAKYFLADKPIPVINQVSESFQATPSGAKNKFSITNQKTRASDFHPPPKLLNSTPFVPPPALAEPTDLQRTIHSDIVDAYDKNPSLNALGMTWSAVQKEHAPALALSNLNASQTLMLLQMKRKTDCASTLTSACASNFIQSAKQAAILARNNETQKFLEHPFIATAMITSPGIAARSEAILLKNPTSKLAWLNMGLSFFPVAGKIGAEASAAVELAEEESSLASGLLRQGLYQGARHVVRIKAEQSLGPGTEKDQKNILKRTPLTHE